MQEQRLEQTREHASCYDQGGVTLSVSRGSHRRKLAQYDTSYGQATGGGSLTPSAQAAWDGKGRFKM